VKHVRVKQKQHPYDKWVKMRHEMREADINRKALIQNIANFLQKVLPGNAPVKSKIIKPDFTEHPPSTPDFTEHPPSPIHTDTTSVWPSPASLPSTSHEIIYETPIRSEEEEEMEVEGADYVSEPEVTEFSTKHFGSVASLYVSSYAFRDRNVDKDFGIRREADRTFKIGTSTVEIDPRSNVYVQGKMYEGTPGLFELLTRKKVDHSLISTNDLKSYRHILNATNAHRENHDPTGVIKTTRGIKFHDVIAKLFPGTRQRGLETALRRRWIKYPPSLKEKI